MQGKVALCGVEADCKKFLRERHRDNRFPFVVPMRAGEDAAKIREWVCSAFHVDL